ncbi:glycosyltransferase family 2 protein [Leptospirillum ferriphilum]|jgi:galactofuranosylgalactofuranosylrhamnosyl-N-acetylglucosaminyl-diphospho-decaprenol beta-1,5/1,6-galactofuranosyltransferase|uniref:Probable glycosyl transferase, family 2 n=2 Tax=Leptospirillum TaxID=179 RepID=B6AQE7_9BACT|nr:glycosyltransferase [Leptospirillum ferriphilum]EDZ38468.1 MAG: Probable glycosyl transferase, family 2 [Leptospirillum sp. Group II '5-way CG']KGA94330.1 putative glycosyltransferase [Leptospirillum ferriphilum]
MKNIAILPKKEKETSYPDKNFSQTICLQNFLYDFTSFGIDSLWGHSSHPIQRTDRKISSISSKETSTLKFDGIANLYPIDYFLSHTPVSGVSLKTHLSADNARILIVNISRQNTRTILFDEKITNFSGEFLSDWINTSDLEGSLHLEIEYKGTLEISQTAWVTSLSKPILASSILLSITAFNRDEFVLPLLDSLCGYPPLLSINLQILVVDNGGSLSRDKLPDDSRIRLIKQTNLGCTSGVMRGLAMARDLKTDFMVIADDDIILPPEMLYRLLLFQILSGKGLSVGAGMLTLQSPNILWEKGSLVLDQGLNSLKPLHKRTNLEIQKNLTPLFQVDKLDYTALWLMSAPTEKLSFLPAFFIYYEDVLQGLLLKKNGVQVLVPPHIFLWHATLEKRGAFWKRYLWVRNDLATRFLNPEKLNPFLVVFSFLGLIANLLKSYDYKLAEFHLQAFKEAITDVSWTIDPLGEKKKTDILIQQNPAQVDLSSRLPKDFLIQKKNSLGLKILKRLGNILTLGNYLNPFSKSVRDDGKLLFRFHGDYESWGWFGYHTLAVVDKKGIGYLCHRSWKKAVKFIFPCLSLSFRFLISRNTLSKRYKEHMHHYENAWRDTFLILDTKNRETSPEGSK